MELRKDDVYITLWEKSFSERKENTGRVRMGKKEGLSDILQGAGEGKT